MLEKMIKEVNPYYKLFCNFRDVIEMHELTKPNIKLRMFLVNPDKNDTTKDGNFTRNRFVAEFAIGQIAAIIEEDEGEIPSDIGVRLSIFIDFNFKYNNTDNMNISIKIAIYPRNSEVQYLNIRDINNEPMCYPILFPYGEPGFNKNTLHNKLTKTRNRLTLSEYASFRLCIRKDNLNLLFKTGQLFQQYIVNLFVNIESNNLAFIKNNQSQLRVEDYKGLVEYLNKKAEIDNTKAGKMLILPSSFEVILLFYLKLLNIL